MPLNTNSCLHLFYEAESSGCHFYLLQLVAKKTFSAVEADSNHIIFCLEGKIQISDDSYQKVLDTGEVFFFTHLSKWKGETLVNTRLIIHAFNHNTYQFDKQLLYASFLYGQKLSVQKENTSIILPIKSALKQILYTIDAYLNDKKKDDLIWNIKHQETLYVFTQYYTREDLYHFFYPLYIDFAAFKSLVLTHANRIKDCAELAECCGYSLKTFRRVFKQEFGKPVLQWLHENKAARIKRLILLSDVSFKEIIYQFGFTSASHFNKFCKKNLGETPTSMRAKFACNYEKE